MTKGFTLIELLVAMAVTAMGIVFVTYFTIDLSNFGADLNSRLKSERELELALRVIVSEIRSMGPGENGAYPVATATGTTFTFFSDVDADGSFEQIRYYLENGTLKKGIIKPTATEPILYPAANEVATEVVHSIISSSVFTYYAEGYPTVIGALPQPVVIPSIRMISVTVTVDDDITQSPSATTLFTNATIRNLRGEI